MSCAPDNDQESFKSAGPQSLGTVPPRAGKPESQVVDQ